MTNLLNYFPTLEIYVGIYDNFPAQVSGLLRFVESDPQWSAIRHIPCLNYMMNLVFIYALKFPLVAEVVFIFPGIIHMLNSRDAFEIIRRHCPTIVRTQWVCLVDVLGLVLKHLNSVQTLFHSADEPLILVTCIHLYILLLPPALFSRAMETRSRLLAEVIPAAREVLREWSEAWNFFGDSPAVTGCLNILTTHFLERLRMNAFDTILTAYNLSPHSRTDIWPREAGFQTAGPIDKLKDCLRCGHGRGIWPCFARRTRGSSESQRIC
jgi:hypothetical protein